MGFVLRRLEVAQREFSRHIGYPIGLAGVGARPGVEYSGSHE
jgi:hypothetical protein